MKNRNTRIILIYLCIFAIFLLIPLWGNRVISTYSDGMQLQSYVIVDAGHGGVDGGAVSCTGAYESQINLEIARCLNDMLHLLGRHTIMIRTDDRSIHTEGTSIASKKVSDIKERVRIANTTPLATYISIHQNHFSNPKYRGAQVFYNRNKESEALAKSLQASLRRILDPNNKRQIKQTTGVFLMEHIQCTAVLVECGFLSNPQEEQLLRNQEYQKKLAAIIAATTCQYLNT